MAARKKSSPKKRGKVPPRRGMATRSSTNASAARWQTEPDRYEQLITTPGTPATSPSSVAGSDDTLPLDVIHRLLTENTPVTETSTSRTTTPQQVVTRLPFPMISPIVRRRQFNFNETIDLCDEDDESPLALDSLALEDVSDTSLPLPTPLPAPASSSKRGRSRTPRGKSTSPVDPNNPGITEIVLGSDTEEEDEDDDEIEVVGIVSNSTNAGRGMAGGGRARGSSSSSRRGKRKSNKRARAGSLTGTGTPLGVQRNRNPGTPPRPPTQPRPGFKGLRDSRIQDKMPWKKGKTRWGAELPIAKRRKSMQMTASLAATASARGRFLRDRMTKDSPFMKRLENINPTHRGLIKHCYGHFAGSSGNQAPVPRTSPGFAGSQHRPYIVPNPMNGNNAKFFRSNTHRVLRQPPPRVESPRLGKPRPIVIDGSNVAVGHGGPSRAFSCRGLELMVKKIQLDLPHSEIVVFVPRYRAKYSESKDTYVLDNLEKEGILKYTPSREAGGKRIASYDDRFILGYAVQVGGIVVSNDNFRDLYDSEPSWRDTITNRLLQFTWINDTLMFPNDPLGQNGPTLPEFLCFPPEPQQSTSNS